MTKGIELANVSEIPEKMGQVFKVADKEIAVFHLSNGEVRAIENQSPHPKGGTLVDGLVSGEYIYCPVYDWKISLVDGKVQAPDEGQVTVYPIQVVNNKIYMQL
jgi:nitrite reductase (NADH) small subunit